jgi:hypothetical protein
MQEVRLLVSGIHGFTVTKEIADVLLSEFPDKIKVVEE